MGNYKLTQMDIDHLYLARYNYRMDENGNMTSEYENGSKEYLQNDLLDSMMTLLKDVENSINCLYKSIDNDTELVENVASQIEESGSTKDDPFNFSTLHELVLRKNDYITGKKGIGPFALNVTNQILTYLYGVSFKPTKFTKATGIMRFDHLLDIDDKSINSWLSAFINAHVDIVKDPYISKLNVNAFTYNMLNMLIRSGWGETALWFLAQPVIREMALANDKANSQYAKDLDKSKKGGSARDAAIAEAVNKHVPEQYTTDEIIKIYTTSIKEEDIKEKIDVVNWLKDNRQLLADIATNKSTLTPQQIQEVQTKVFYAWKALEKYSLALGDFVQHTKIDTRKHGKTLVGINRYLRDYNKLFHPTGRDKEESIWDLDTLRILERESWIGFKTNNAITLTTDILGRMTFNANKAFMDAVIRFGDLLSYDGRKMNEAGLMKISRSLLTAIKSKYFVDYAKTKLGMTDEDIKGLFVGNRSISRRLVALKSAILNNPKYRYLQYNTFINQVFSPVEDKPVAANGRELQDRPAFITVLDNVDDSRVNQDLLSEGWLELLNDSDPFVSKFARQLIVYAFLSSGEFRGWNKLLKYVPYEFISGETDPDYKSYSQFVNEKLNQYTSYTEFLDDIVSNNFMDYVFSKKLKDENDDGSKNFIYVTDGIKIGASVEYRQTRDCPLYITTRIPNMLGRGVSNYELYKRVAFINNKGKYHPLYVKIKKKGYSKQGYNIYEYGWNFNYAENEQQYYDQFDFKEALLRVRNFMDSGALNGLSDESALAISRVYYNQESIKPEEKKQTKTIEDGAHLATRGYKKGDPQKHPEFNYVFTENAQAYVASAPQSDATVDADLFLHVGATTSVKLNVSDANGTNQAGIRTDEHGNITPNAYGIVVRKRQQDDDGNFLAKEGLFEDTEEDFKIFTSLNEDMFKRLEASPNKVVIFPTQIALGKSALPYRFAKWLQDQLAKRYNIISEIKKTERADYNGYGLQLNEVNDTTYDWEYMEDSTDSGVLKELPPKVRMNGKYTYRPRYNFGRVYLTDNEREFVDEKITATINGTEYSSKEIDRIARLYDSGILNINTFGKMPIGDNGKVPIPKEYENEINTLFDLALISETDFNEDGDKISPRAIEYVKSLIQNNIYDFAVGPYADMAGNNSISDFDAFRMPFKEFLYEMMDQYLETDVIDEKNNISYSYSDKRQQELFSEEDFELSEDEQQEAERYRKLCEGV